MISRLNAKYALTLYDEKRPGKEKENPTYGYYICSLYSDGLMQGSNIIDSGEEIASLKECIEQVREKVNDYIDNIYKVEIEDQNRYKE